MFSRPIRFLSILSLISMAITLAFWMRSQGWQDVHWFEWRGKQWEFVSRDGELRIDDDYSALRQAKFKQLIDEKMRVDSEKAMLLDEIRLSESGVPTSEIAARLKLAEVACDRAMSAAVDLASEPQLPVTTYSVRLIKVLLVVSILPAVQLARISIVLSLIMLTWLSSRTKAARGLCVYCGYDLRATPGRCPECGKVVVSTGRVHNLVRDLANGKVPSPTGHSKVPVRWIWYAGLISLIAAIRLIGQRMELVSLAEYATVFFPPAFVVIASVIPMHLMLATAWIIPPQPHATLASPVIRWAVTIIVSLVFGTVLYYSLAQ